jgi:hypothetical protein
MTEDEKQEILAESRRLLDELKDFKPREHDPLHEDAFEDPVQRWKREADELTARRAAFAAEQHRREREKKETAMVQTKAESDAAWEGWLAARLEQDWQYRSEILVGVIVELRKETSRAIKKAVSTLRDELVTNRGHDDGTVIDIPSPIRKRGHGQAA